MAGIANLFALIDQLKRNVGRNLQDPMGAVELGLLRADEDFKTDPVNTVLGNANIGGGLLGMTKMVKPPKAPQADALETARRNAVEMLGLPENNTAMDRAKAMGFDIGGYHGTGNVFDEMGSNQRGTYFTTPDPVFANKYAGGEYSVEVGEKPNVIPTLSKSSKIFDYENKADVKKLAQKASLGKLAIDQIKKGDWRRLEDRTLLNSLKDLGYDGLYVKEDGIKNFAAFNPNQIRSRFAAFDPARRNESNLLASRLLPLALPGLLFAGDEEE